MLSNHEPSIDEQKVVFRNFVSQVRGFALRDRNFDTLILRIQLVADIANVAS